MLSNILVDNPKVINAQNQKIGSLWDYRAQLKPYYRSLGLPFPLKAHYEGLELLREVSYDLLGTYLRIGSKASNLSEEKMFIDGLRRIEIFQSFCNFELT